MQQVAFYDVPTVRAPVNLFDAKHDPIVYFLVYTHAKDLWFKIGTSRSIRPRMYPFSIGYGSYVSLVRAIEGDGNTEHTLHHRFAHLNAQSAHPGIAPPSGGFRTIKGKIRDPKGEWFIEDDELLSFVAGLPLWSAVLEIERWFRSLNKRLRGSPEPSHQRADLDLRCNHASR